MISARLAIGANRSRLARSRPVGFGRSTRGIDVTPCDPNFYGTTMLEQLNSCRRIATLRALQQRESSHLESRRN
jgi:hypothetical protein